MAEYLDIEIEAGATWEREWSVVDEDGIPADLSGYSARMDIKRSATDPETLLTLITTNDTLTILADSGMIVARIEAADTAALPWRAAVYDVLLSNDTDTWRIVEGTVTVVPGITEL